MLSLAITDTKICAQSKFKYKKPKYIMSVLLNDKTRIKGFLMDQTDSTMIFTTVRKPHKHTLIDESGDPDYSESLYANILSIGFDDINKIKFNNTSLFKNSFLILT